MSSKDLINKLRINMKKIEILQKNKEPCFITTQIVMPVEIDINKKIIALQFTEDFEKNKQDCKSFIILTKKYHIINFSITVNIENFDKNKDYKEYCSFTLGIRGCNKIKTIKSSKVWASINSAIDNQLIISNTIVYFSKEKQELCLIATTLPKNTYINRKLSILSMLSF
jgi:hypothetical protein